MHPESMEGLTRPPIILSPEAEFSPRQREFPPTPSSCSCPSPFCLFPSQTESTVGAPLSHSPASKKVIRQVSLGR